MAARPTAANRALYPFVPLSTAYLEPGQFWSVPLSDGRYACGRVLQLQEEVGRRDRRLFLAGLMNWVGDAPPSQGAIAGSGLLAQGEVHVKTISENNGEILGYRPLELDGIEPGLFVDPWGGSICMLRRGFLAVRPATTADRHIHPRLTTWGYRVIRVLAEKFFVSPAAYMLGGTPNVSAQPPARSGPGEADHLA